MIEYKDESGWLFTELNDDNFELFAVKNYCNPVCSGVEEFYEDLNRIKYIKRQISKYYLNDDINERLFLNNMITFFNVFEIQAAKVMLFQKIEREFWELLKTTIVFLGFMKPTELPQVSIDPIIHKKLLAL